MKSLVELSQRRSERLFLVGADWKREGAADVEESLSELAALAATAGGEVVGKGVQRLQAPMAATFIGSGKAAEFARFCRENTVDTVVFDDELSPAQTRNLERIFECKILDRTALILDIFAQRARTREGKLQVELAQLRHLLPRLTRFWTHLSRQKGGIGMRGEGETQLETDQRKVMERILRITRELNEVRRQRSTQRAGRRRHVWPLASIVGYTNAGKSTLLNALTGAKVLVEDKLFATLDPTTRRLRLPTNQSVLLSDTVGFIRKLPHGLVEAFKATLEEVAVADLLIHVVDVSQPQARDQMRAVHDVLSEIGAAGKPALVVLNKTDRLDDHGALARWAAELPEAVPVSALRGEGFAELLAALGACLRPARELVELEIPHTAAAVLARAHAVGQVLSQAHRAKGTRLKVRVPPHLQSEFAPYLIPARRRG